MKEIGNIKGSDTFRPPRWRPVKWGNHYSESVSVWLKWKDVCIKISDVIKWLPFYMESNCFCLVGLINLSATFFYYQDTRNQMIPFINIFKKYIYTILYIFYIYNFYIANTHKLVKHWHLVFRIEVCRVQYQLNELSDFNKSNTCYTL